MPPLPVRLLFPSPLFATLADHLQLPENPATLSPFPATLTRRVNHNPFACHSYEKHPGAGASALFVIPREPRNLLLLFQFATHHSPLATKFPIIRTSEKHTDNPFRIRTSKTQDLKLFRMNTYEKTQEGGPLLTTTSLLKPPLQMAHQCKCKKGPAAREPRYSPCAAS